MARQTTLHRRKKEAPKGEEVQKTPPAKKRVDPSSFEGRRTELEDFDGAMVEGLGDYLEQGREKGEDEQAARRAE